MSPRYARIETTLGELQLVADGARLTGLYFPGHWHTPKPDALGSEVDVEDDAVLTQAQAELARYLEGDRQTFDVPILASGEEFSERVWTLLQTIPYGATTTYGTLAKELGNRKLAQRVGQAVGRNPLSIFIPCHRVVGADGSLTGYAGGIERKRWLLELEEPASASDSRLF